MEVDAVTALVTRVADTVVLARFRDLGEGEVLTKGADDVVTVVDTAAEAALVEGLGEIAPGVPVIGEEGVAADPRLLGALAGADRAFVVDPIDGTRAFVEGVPDFAVMVAMVEHGESVAGWICLPALGSTYVAERGSGAFRDGVRLPHLVRGEPLRGGVASALMPRELREGLAPRAKAAGLVGIRTGVRLWSGRWYTMVATGEADVLVYWNTWPWDHAPGAVLVREVGGVVRRPDGTDYRPDDQRRGLVVAPDATSFARVRDGLGLRG